MAFVIHTLNNLMGFEQCYTYLHSIPSVLINLNTQLQTETWNTGKAQFFMPLKNVKSTILNLFGSRFPYIGLSVMPWCLV